MSRVSDAIRRAVGAEATRLEREAKSRAPLKSPEMALRREAWLARARHYQHSEGRDE